MLYCFDNYEDLNNDFWLYYKTWGDLESEIFNKKMKELFGD